MIIAINLALLPVAFVAVMGRSRVASVVATATPDPRPPRVDPEAAEHMTPFPQDVGGAVEAYAAYLNAPRGILDYEEQVLFDEDIARARAAMERAWLESTPVQRVGPGATSP